MRLIKVRVSAQSGGTLRTADIFRICGEPTVSAKYSPDYELLIVWSR